MQTLYFTDIRRLAPLAGGLSRLLRPERLRKMQSYRNADDRLRCLAGGLLIERIAQGQEILYNENGKPFFPDGPYFSLSHSGHFVCLAVSSTAPVGLDIEIRREEDFVGMGKTAFHPVELAFLLQQPTADLFYYIWTAKESYAKMIGTGFSVEPSHFCVLPECMALVTEQQPFFRSFSFIEGYSLTLCAAEPIQADVNELFFDMGGPGGPRPLGPTVP
jgi:4'-phosphopantetheinyl transferase